jgi:hypothetical protein
LFVGIVASAKSNAHDSSYKNERLKPAMILTNLCVITNKTSKAQGFPLFFSALRGRDFG